MKRLLTVGSTIGATALVLTVLTAAPAGAANDPLAALVTADPTAVSEAANVPTRATGTNAIHATVAKAAVNVPVDPSAPVTLGAGGAALRIGLPFADKAGNAIVEKPGIVAYDNKNGSMTIPAVRKDGRVQLNTVIASAKAPARYDYRLGVPEGQFLELAPDGSAYIATENGSVITGVVSSPWAKDARGKPVSTHYEIAGNTLTQVVDFTRNTAFPVVADPSISFGTYIVVKMSQATAQAIAGGSAATAVALLSLGGPLVGVLAAAVYGTVASYNAAGLAKCRIWAFSFTYLGQLVKGSCA